MLNISNFLGSGETSLFSNRSSLIGKVASVLAIPLIIGALTAGWRPCSPELLESGVDCDKAPRWFAGPIGQHWHPPVGELPKQNGCA